MHVTEIRTKFASLSLTPMPHAAPHAPMQVPIYALNQHLVLVRLQAVE